MNKDKRASLTINAGNFKSLSEGRVSIIGNIEKVEDKEKVIKLRENYLKRFKDAYWIDFG